MGRDKKIFNSKETAKLIEARAILLNGNKRTLSLDEILDVLPRQTINGETYGLCLMVCNGPTVKQYSCSYYSHFLKESNNDVPVMVGKTHKDAALKMLKWMIRFKPDKFK